METYINFLFAVMGTTITLFAVGLSIGLLFETMDTYLDINVTAWLKKKIKKRQNMTNYEKIKNMTVSELAEMLMAPSICDFCIHHESGEDCVEKCNDKYQKSNIMQWLDSEVEE